MSPPRPRPPSVTPEHGHCTSHGRDSPGTRPSQFWVRGNRRRSRQARAPGALLPGVEGGALGPRLLRTKDRGNGLSESLCTGLVLLTSGPNWAQWVNAWPGSAGWGAGQVRAAMQLAPGMRLPRTGLQEEAALTSLSSSLPRPGPPLPSTLSPPDPDRLCPHVLPTSEPLTPRHPRSPGRRRSVV